MKKDQSTVKLSRRDMLGKSAKYAALVPVSTLIATKANAHSYSGTSQAECEATHGNGTNSGDHCGVPRDQHPNIIFN